MNWLLKVYWDHMVKLVRQNLYQNTETPSYQFNYFRICKILVGMQCMHTVVFFDEKGPSVIAFVLQSIETYWPKHIANEINCRINFVSNMFFLGIVAGTSITWNLWVCKWTYQAGQMLWIDPRTITKLLTDLIWITNKKYWSNVFVTNPDRRNVYLLVWTLLESCVLNKLSHKKCPLLHLYTVRKLCSVNHYFSCQSR